MNTLLQAIIMTAFGAVIIGTSIAVSAGLEITVLGGLLAVVGIASLVMYFVEKKKNK